MIMMIIATIIITVIIPLICFHDKVERKMKAATDSSQG